ncbi:MAG TPA: hypothetical protein VLV83_20290 [Acidobacteriota bacterium]|nr:hypothetical protein [Acidobacteriota bacterium]
MTRRFFAALGVLLFLSALAADNGEILEKSYLEWTQEEAVWVLNESPWARRETFTQVVEGVGSGVRGEREILSTYFVRFLSAPPIRQAYVRIQQLQNGYAEMTDADQRDFDANSRRLLRLPVRQWIVITLAFRSNEPDRELEFKQHFQVQTIETLRRTTSLSTPRFAKLEPVAYFPPAEDGVGARFVFPRQVDGVDVISPQDATVSFEIEVPVATPQVRSQFSVAEMELDGVLVY